MRKLSIPGIVEICAIRAEAINISIQEMSSGGWVAIDTSTVGAH